MDRCVMCMVPRTSQERSRRQITSKQRFGPMTTLSRTTASLAAVAAIACMQPADASATAYGFATNEITNFQILVDSGSITTSSTTERTNTNQTTFNGNAGPDGSHTVNSRNSVPSDALQAFSGPNANVVGENNYTFRAGQTAGLLGSRGDSNVGAGRSFTSNGGTVNNSGTGITAINSVAEALGTSSDVATGDARNTRVGQFTVGPDGATLHFSFNAAVALSASTSLSGDVSQVTVGNDFEITGPTNFSYLPSAINLTQSSANGLNTIDYQSGVQSFVSPEAILAPGLYNYSRRNETQVNLQGRGELRGCAGACVHRRGRGGPRRLDLPPAPPRFGRTPFDQAALRLIRRGRRRGRRQPSARAEAGALPFAVSGLPVVEARLGSMRWRRRRGLRRHRCGLNPADHALKPDLAPGACAPQHVEGRFAVHLVRHGILQARPGAQKGRPRGVIGPGTRRRNRGQGRHGRRNHGTVRTHRALPCVTPD